MRLTLAQRLYGISAGGVALTLMVGVLVFFVFRGLEKDLREMVVAMASLRSQMDANMMRQNVRSDVMDALLAQNPEDRRVAEGNARAHLNRMAERIAQNKDRGVTMEIRGMAMDLEPQVNRYGRMAVQVIEAAKARPDQAAASLREFQGLYADLEFGLKAMEDKIGESILVIEQRRSAIARSGRFFAIILCFGVPVVLVVAAFMNFRSFRRALVEAVGTLQELAIADVSNRLSISSKNAHDTMSQAASVSTSAEQVSKNYQSVAAGVEQLAVSIKEVTKSAHEAAQVAFTGVKIAEATNATVARLGESSGEIGKVIDVINAIAEQTNLLALNAAIEAARAGDAGRGFAVVANEVKELAKGTARATDEIRQKIQAIQTDTMSSVKAIEEISNIIKQMNSFQGTIAGAVEQQAATTSEIGRSAAEAAHGSVEIVRNIASVADMAKGTVTETETIRRATSELRARMVAVLAGVVGGNGHRHDKPGGGQKGA